MVKICVILCSMYALLSHLHLSVCLQVINNYSVSTLKSDEDDGLVVVVGKKSKVKSQSISQSTSKPSYDPSWLRSGYGPLQREIQTKKNVVINQQQKLNVNLSIKARIVQWKNPYAISAFLLISLRCILLLVIL